VLAYKNRHSSSAAVALILLAVLWCTPAFGFHSISPNEVLDSGGVEISLKKEAGINFVVGKILINEPPAKVWPVMTNPFEFRGKISPRMRQVEVMVDKKNYSLLKCSVHVGFFIPDITYVVASQYQPVEKVLFRRTGGDLRDFRGTWDMEPAHSGTKTELTYSMFFDPGIPVPQWIIREGVKGELPRLLTALRERVDAVYLEHKALENPTILAAGTSPAANIRLTAATKPATNLAHTAR
jgi:hypothetical protein